MVESAMCVNFTNKLIIENYNESYKILKLTFIYRELQNRLPRIYKSTQDYVQEQVGWRHANEELFTEANSFIHKIVINWKAHMNEFVSWNYLRFGVNIPLTQYFLGSAPLLIFFRLSTYPIMAYMGGFLPPS